MRRLFLALAALLAGLALAGCHDARQVSASPPLWKVSDGDTTIWLLGSIHMLPANIRWRTPAVEAAIADSNRLILEIPPGDPGKASAAFLKKARARQAVAIEQRLPRAKRALLGAAVKHAGVERATLDGLKDWGAALMLAAGDAREAGATRADGVEAVLTGEFQAAEKPIDAFETLDEQFAIFDSLNPADQRRLLTNAVTDAASDDGYARGLAAWRAGDAKALESAADMLFTDAPGLKAALLTRRNARWAARIKREMRRPETVLIAVGAGHLAGDDGLPALLARKGYAVTRVQ
ncbi:TraB/GumN family protein [Stakelama sp. CBK3Z-3]|uniref:TraB/GumN family protein n=1 Tax=Stakelama flava TaxID=2860338 RepID=A0ABS6XMR3_9SPHN|nr:TraB/GumN family protein [Stakelama flava]MBW4331508.1 TraB/GumN family protein [Stakelama flava]